MMFSDVVAALGVVELTALSVVLVALVRPKQKEELGLVPRSWRAHAETATEQRKVA